MKVLTLLASLVAFAPTAHAQSWLYQYQQQQQIQAQADVLQQMRDEASADRDERMTQRSLNRMRECYRDARFCY